MMDDLLNNYEKIKVIGHGSYGEVWLVKHGTDKKQYVLKKLDLRNASKKERCGAEQECRLLSQLRHPNIVTYKESFETPEGFLYIAMGFCEAGDLYTKLKHQKGKLLEEKQIVEWFIQIAMALRYMHSQNVMHRDLKTQNIFLTRSKIIKVGDLGIARVLDSSGDMAKTLIGTPYYMSPEIFSNKPYNFKSDVWALGCCVFEMATLRHAFNGKDLNSLMYQIQRGKLPQMPEIYSEELKRLIQAMMQRVPEKRPSVERILKDAFIQKHIAIFLKETRKSQSSKKSVEKETPRRVRSADRSTAVMERKKADEVTEPLKCGPELEVIPEENSGGLSPSPSNGRERGVSKGGADEAKLMLLVGAVEDKKPPRTISQSKSDPAINKRIRKPSLPHHHHHQHHHRGHDDDDDDNDDDGRARDGSVFKEEREIVSTKSSPSVEAKKKLTKQSALPSSSSSPLLNHPPPNITSTAAAQKSSRPLPHLPKKSSKPPEVSVSLLKASKSTSSFEDQCRVSSTSTSSSTSSSSSGPLVSASQKQDKSREELSLAVSDDAVPDSSRLDTARGARARRRQRILSENPVNIDLAKGKLLTQSSGTSERVEMRASRNDVPEPSKHANVSKASSNPFSASVSSSSSSSVAASSSSSLERRKSDTDTKWKDFNPSFPPLSSSRSPGERPLSTDRSGKRRRRSDLPKGQSSSAAVPKSHSKSRHSRSAFVVESRRDGDDDGGDDDENDDVKVLTGAPDSTDSSTPEEDAGKVETKRNKKEMNKFLFLLGTLTLRRKKEDDDDNGDDDDEEEDDDDNDDIKSGDKPPRIVKSTEKIHSTKKPTTISTTKADTKRMLPDANDFQSSRESRQQQQFQYEPIEQSSLVDDMEMTMTGVLYNRISSLRKDCIRNLGVCKIKKAYEILDKFVEEDFGPPLLELLGQSDYDNYAGKIMQLKYYEETASGTRT